MIIYSPEISGSVTISGSLTIQGAATLTASLATSASYALTASYALNGGGTTIDTGSFVTNSQTSSFVRNAQTGSFLTTGSSGASQTISGSLTINQNLTVLGSSSITNITSSQLNIGTNLITVNTNTPGVRFGGLSVIDSGSSPQRSGSILFDSTNDQWVFVHQNTGGAVTSSVFIQTPQTFNNLGNETSLTTNRIPKSTNAEHIGDSNITDTGTLIQLNSATQVTGSLNVSAGITGSLFGTSSFANTASALFVTNVTDGASYSLVLVGTGTTGNKTLQNTTAATIGIVPSVGRITATSVTASISSSLITIASTLSAPFTLSSTNATSTAYAGQITATSGMQGFRVNTNGQAQYVARSSTHADRELRFQLFSDGNTYFGQQGLTGQITSDLIIRTGADAGANSGSIRFTLMGSNKMAITPTGIKIGNQATALSAASELDVSGSFTMTGSMIYASPTSPGFNGEVVKFGAGTLTTGQLYFLSSSGTWSLANANSTGSSIGMLGLALGSSPTTNGLLIRGLAASSSYTYGTGSVIYMATSSGAMTATSPSSSNHVVRVMGYQTTLSNTIYFMPDATWVTLA